MKTLFTTTGVAVLLGATMMLNSMTASATDDKIHPGSMCQPKLAADAQYVNYLDAAVAHSKQTRVSFSCPVVRDNTTNTNGIYRVLVRLKTGSISSQTRCGVLTRGHNGELLSSKLLNATPARFTSQTVTFAGINSSAKNGEHTK